MKRRRRVLIVDDDPSVVEWLSLFAEGLGYEVQTAETGEQALEIFRRRRPDLVTLDVLLPGMDGMLVLKAMREHDKRVPVIMLSGHGQTRVIVESLQAGAVDFLLKPVEPEGLRLAFQKALEKSQLESEVHHLRSQLRGRGASTPSLFMSQGNPKLEAIEDVIDHVADTDVTVLIRGESGTGKELVARTLFQNSCRAHRPFVKVNCAALPEGLLESELFGYEKGAFTGAHRRKLGKFEMADGGTIFLDEISEMTPALQAKLLQVLQDGQFSRLGGTDDVQVEVRIIAACNGNLEEGVRLGTFREDLFYRLNVVTIHIPPLRERTDEIPLLAEHFLKQFTEAYGKECPAISETLMEAFMACEWPGNVRELENLIKRLVVLGDEASLLHELSSRKARARRTPTAAAGSSELEQYLAGQVPVVSLKRIAREAAQVAERRLIAKVLQRTRWNRKAAARILQISYKALLYKMKDAGLADSIR